MTNDDWDPFVAPQPSHRIADAPARGRVVLRGLVVGVEVAQWSGGAVLEVTLFDGSGEMCLAFFGRRQIGGIETGRVLTAGGTVGRRRGRPILLNAQYWLHAPLEEVPDA